MDLTDAVDKVSLSLVVMPAPSQCSTGNTKLRQKLIFGDLPVVRTACLYVGSLLAYLHRKGFISSLIDIGPTTKLMVL